MSIHNSYPALPELAYRHTTVEMPIVVVFAKSLVGKYEVDTVRMAYAIFRNESGNGKYGVNNNYAGIQADVGVWQNLPGHAIATCIKKDNNGDLRRFLCFKDDEGYKISFELLCIKISERKITTIDDYFKKWISNPSEDNVTARNDFKSLLNSASKVFI
jgi:hypothetical protein